MIPFQQKCYYTAEIKSSYSIKYMLPAWVTKLSRNNLEIKEGGKVSNTFLSIVNKTFESDFDGTRR